MEKPITIKLTKQFAKALRLYKVCDPRHMSMPEQVRRALICYWNAQHTPEAARCVEIAMNTHDEPEKMWTIAPDIENYRAVPDDK